MMDNETTTVGKTVPCISLTDVLKVISDEPELPGHMPDELWRAMAESKDVAEEAMRSVVRLTKKVICKRIEATVNSAIVPKPMSRNGGYCYVCGRTMHTQTRTLIAHKPDADHIYCMWCGVKLAILQQADEKG